jgi:hypothetical protein
MFAKRDTKKGEKLLDAPSATGTSNMHTTGKYCYNCAAKLTTSLIVTFNCCPTMKFCGDECRGIAEMNYHTALCGKDLDEFYQAAMSNDFTESANARAALSFMRLIAISVQAGTHPLKTPPMSWLVANHEAQSPLPWTRAGNVTGPIKVLQKLGIDIFTDDYDTWVLQTVW